MKSRYSVPDEVWQRIEGLLPGRADQRGVTAKDNRLFVDAVLWIARTGAPWRDLPERFGKWNSVYRRFQRLALAGVWQRVFEEFADADLRQLMVDSTSVRAHQHAAGARKKTGRSPLGAPAAD
ncbi:IS5 family transposase [Flaviaesturariibacter amylovorans]|uniref:IS5 family transposase n=1 Tax=Flaviaesturariibacter amylovorans TaxID=1084520 RepID=A0ABP8HD73_9BACT